MIIPLSPEMAKQNSSQLCPFKGIIKTGTQILGNRDQNGEWIENPVCESQLEEPGMLIPEKTNLG